MLNNNNNNITNNINNNNKLCLYEHVIEKLINNEITCESLINIITINLNNFTNQKHIVLNETTNLNLTQKNDLNTHLNNDFISYFLGLLHEEGNRYLTIVNKSNNCTLLENNNEQKTTTFRNQDYNPNQQQTPVYITPKSASKQRKISLQPINYSPNNQTTSNIIQFNSSIDYNSPTNTFKSRKSNVSITSPNNNYNNSNSNYFNNNSPRQQTTNNYAPFKQPTKPTLFDYISTPIKSPTKFDAPLHPHVEKISMKMHLLNVNQNQTTNNNNNNEQPTNNTAANSSNASNVQVITNDKDLGTNVKNSINSNEKEKLEIIAKFYSDLILNNLVFTMNTELFFLFQLLTLNSLEEDYIKNDKKMKIFSSIESCIYFAINAIRNLECIVKHLKDPLILELQQNIYFKTFSNLFSNDSFILNHKLTTEELKSKSRLVFFELKQVPFYADIHVRENFPVYSDHLFVAFKTQRDVFYDILYDWEKNHKLENWNFSEVHGQRIKELVSLEPYGTNCLCFIKLFQEQLILMCKHDKMFIDMKDEELNGPDYIKTAYDPLKLKRLNARMSTPNPNYGPNPGPKFTGYQEFFKEFIDFTASSTFYQLLKDSLILEIHKLHEEIPNIEDGNENSINKSTIEDMLLRLRIIGKFLGYLIHSPYQAVFVPNYLVKEINSTRNINFPINLKAYMEKAIEHKHLIVTVPFIVEFLSMMDENAMSIDVIRDTFSLLIFTFRSQYMNINCEAFTIDKLLILLSITWLLQLKIASNSQFQVNANINFKQSKTGLDNLNIITPLLLHYCCPYLDELHKLLTKFNSGVKKSLQHINNVSNVFGFEFVQESVKQCLDAKQIQSQLETQFFHLHPSLKRVVDYTSERALSTYIKNYKQFTFKQHLNDAKESFINEYADENPEELEKHIRYFAQKCSKDFTKKCLEHAKEYCETRINNLISLSIDESTHKEVVRTTYCLAKKYTFQKLQQWMKVHLSEDIFYDEFKNKDIKKRLIERSLLVSSNIDTDQTKLFNNTICNETKLELPFINDDSEQIQMSDLFNEIKIIMKGLLLKNKEYINNIESIFKKMHKTIQVSNTPLRNFLAQLASEIIILYVSMCCDKLSDEILEEYFQIEYFVNSSNYNSVFDRILCKRNFYIIKSSSETTSRINYQQLFNFLMIKYKNTISDTDKTSYNDRINKEIGTD